MFEPSFKNTVSVDPVFGTKLIPAVVAVTVATVPVTSVPGPSTVNVSPGEYPAPAATTVI